MIFKSCLNLCNFLKLFRFWLLLFHVSCFMIVLWLEIRDVFLRFFLLFNSITSAVTASNVGVFKKTWANTWISLLHHRNQFQRSIKFSLKFKSRVGVFYWLYQIGWKALDGIFSCLQITEFTGRWSYCNMLTWKATIHFIDM